MQRLRFRFLVSVGLLELEPLPWLPLLCLVSYATGAVSVGFLGSGYDHDCRYCIIYSAFLVSVALPQSLARLKPKADPSRCATGSRLKQRQCCEGCGFWQSLHCLPILQG